MDAVKDIEHVIELMKPKAFITRWWGYFWGLRVPAIRHIDHWIRVENLFKKIPLTNLSALCGSFFTWHYQHSPPEQRENPREFAAIKVISSISIVLWMNLLELDEVRRS